MVFLLASLVACGGGGGGSDSGSSGGGGSAGSGGNSGGGTGGGTGGNATTKTFALSLSEIAVVRMVNDEAVNVDINGIESNDLALD